jgi:threonine aldolase
MMHKVIDLRSDTLTKPTFKMREAMMNAEVGDDCHGEDPTVKHLEALAAEKAGKESAVYIPSGTMGNTTAILAHTHAGDYAIVDARCHIYSSERGAMSSLAGVLPIVMESADGCHNHAEVEPHLQQNGAAHSPRISLICLENTHNRRGGQAIALERMRGIHKLAQRYHVPVHLDGARIFNAAHALGVEAREIASHVDSVMFCLSKGLGAPVGSMLAGDADFIEKAREARKRLGGGMRQSGVIAAAGIVALTEMTDRLREDHANARLLAKALSQFDELDLLPEDVHTNIVRLDTKGLEISAAEFANRAAQHNLKVSVQGPTIVRLVTHHDVSREDILHAAEVLVDLVRSILNRSA